MVRYPKTRGRTNCASSSFEKKQNVKSPPRVQFQLRIARKSPISLSNRSSEHLCFCLEPASQRAMALKRPGSEARTLRFHLCRISSSAVFEAVESPPPRPPAQKAGSSRPEFHPPVPISRLLYRRITRLLLLLLRQIHHHHHHHRCSFSCSS